MQLNLEIYSESSIEKTCEVYKEYASIKLKRKGKYITLYFNKCKYDSEITMQEFENYLINVENA